MSTSQFEANERDDDGRGRNTTEIAPDISEIAEGSPLSFTQQGFWEMAQACPDDPLRNVAGLFTLIGPLDLEAFRSALLEIIRRHQVLRSNFIMTPTGVQPRVSDGSAATLTIIDLTQRPEAEREAAMFSRFERQLQTPFDVSRDFLFRVELFKLDNERHIFSCMADHMVCDGWSVGIFIRELSALYNAYCQHQPSPLADLPMQFPDLVRLEQRRLSLSLDGLWNWWHATLDGNNPGIELPTDHPRSNPQPFTLGTARFQLPDGLSEQMRRFSRNTHATLYMTLMAGLNVFLFRRSGLDDLSIMVPVANRTSAESQVLIGPIVNVVVVRSRLTPTPTFRELVRTVKAECMSALARQQLPFEVLLTRTGQTRSYTTMMALENYPQPQLKLRHLKVFERQVVNAPFYDQTMVFYDIPPELTCQYCYNSSLYEPDTVRRYFDELALCIRAGISAPDIPITALPPG